MSLTIHPVHGIPEISEGADLGRLLGEICSDADFGLVDGDVLVVTQKIVSKAEGAVIEIDMDDPLSHKPVVEREAVRILRRRGDLIITETKHGFVCANAGVDLSLIHI